MSEAFDIKAPTSRDKIGIYIHVPFCIRKCPYCDFYSCEKPELIEDYTRALERCIASCGPLMRGKTADTVYFGGGTPSLLPEKNVSKIIEELSCRIGIEKNAEITLEVNPASGAERRFAGYKSAGVNRISIGMQSASDEMLALIGRLHRHADTLNTVKAARRALFDNLSLDLMYGLPYQTLSDWKHSYEEAIRLSPEHISFYALTLSQDSRLYRSGYDYPDDDVQYEMYESFTDAAARAGYVQYEISNCAKPERRSAHNLKYWSLGDYIGFGPGAHSFMSGRRFYTPEDLDGFIAAKEPETLFVTEEDCSDDDLLYELVMLSLRTSEGLAFSKMRRFLPDDDAFCALVEKLKERFAPFEKAGCGTCGDDGIRLNTKGFFISNSIICGLTDR